MKGPASQYEAILRSAGLEEPVPAAPQVFISLEESWTSLTVRYLVGARERRKWKSDLAAAVTMELNRAEQQQEPQVTEALARAEATLEEARQSLAGDVGDGEELPALVEKELGTEKANELGDMLHSAYNVEAVAMGLQEVEDAAEKEPHLAKIEEAAGKFMALANLVRAG